MSGGAYTFLALEQLYELERMLPNRNYANTHSFKEWLDWKFGGKS